jgi:hypothetical protein
MNGATNLVIHAEALWFWDGRQRAYIRFLDINSDSLDLEYIRSIMKPGHPARRMTPCFHYQSAGEVKATHYLEHWFQQNELPYSVQLSRDLALDPTIESENNLVALGNSRSNKFIAALHDGLPIILGPRSIRATGPSPAEYHDDDVPASKETMQSVYVLITRRPSKDGALRFTVIAGNNGRGIEKAVEVLTNPDGVKALLSQIGPKFKEIPETLQIVLQIKIMNYRAAHKDPKVVASAIGSGRRAVRILWAPRKKSATKRKPVPRQNSIPHGQKIERVEIV